MGITNDKLLKKAFKSYLLVNILIVLAGTLGILVDGIVIGQVLDQSSVSAYGLSSSAVVLAAAISGIFSTGSGAMIAAYIGKGDKDGIHKNFTVTMISGIIISAIVTAVCFFWCEPVAKLLGAKDELVPLTADYLKGLSIGMIANMISPTLMQYSRLDGKAAVSFISVIAMTVCNIILDIVFAVTFDMGLFGMGLATSVSYWVSTLILAVIFFDKNSMFKLSFSNGNAKELCVMFNTGIPSALNRACITARKIVINWLLMFLVGSIAVSAFSVQSTVNQFLMAVTMGMGMTTMDMAGIFFGEKNENALEKTLRISIKTGTIINVIICIVLMIFAEPVVKMFMKADAEATSLAVHSLRWFSLSLPFSLICVTFINFYQCTKNLFMANILCVLHGFAFVIMISLGFSPVLGADAVWISFLCAEVLSLLVLIIVVKIKAGKWPKGFRDMIFVPADFTPEPEKILDISIDNDMNKVMELSERIEEFCKKHTEDISKIQKLSLCIEEMAGNIVQHGFKDSKKHSIDIRIVVSESDIIFRIRDDGKKFNPIKYADENQSAAEDNIGIKLIREISKDMNYKYAVNMNNLSVIV